MSLSFSIDASKKVRRIGRLVNHKKTLANVIVKVLQLPVDNLPRLGLFASQTIGIGDELFYDYGERRNNIVVNNPWLAN